MRLPHRAKVPERVSKNGLSSCLPPWIVVEETCRSSTIIHPKSGFAVTVFAKKIFLWLLAKTAFENLEISLGGEAGMAKFKENVAACGFTFFLSLL